MDIQEWELVPRDGFLEIHKDGGEKIFSRRYLSDSQNVLEMNYFTCPSPKSSQFVESTKPIHDPDPSIGTTSDHEVVKETTNKDAIQISIIPSAISEKVIAPDYIGRVIADQDPISQVFFKKMQEHEFVDMKMDSPKSNNNRSKGIISSVDPGSFGFDSEEETIIGEAMKGKNLLTEGKNDEDTDVIKDEANWEENCGGLQIWRWSLSGIGAICSFSVAAAATVFIIVLGGRQKSQQQQQQQQQQQHQQPHKLQFHLYTDDKRLKQVVHQATRLNESISAIKGVPITRAHFSIGGYYDGF